MATLTICEKINYSIRIIATSTGKVSDEPATGYRLENPYGMNLAVRKTVGGHWNIDEYTTGCRLGGYSKTRRDAVESMENFLALKDKSWFATYEKWRLDFIQKYGLVGENATPVNHSTDETAPATPVNHSTEETTPATPVNHSTEETTPATPVNPNVVFDTSAHMRLTPEVP